LQKLAFLQDDEVFLRTFIPTKLDDVQHYERDIRRVQMNDNASMADVHYPIVTGLSEHTRLLRDDMTINGEKSKRNCYCLQLKKKIIELVCLALLQFLVFNEFFS
jgi:hypothetical protein